MADFSDNAIDPSVNADLILERIKDRDIAQAKGLSGSHTGLPNGAIQWQPAQSNWTIQQSGSPVELAAQYNINVQRLQGRGPSTGATANTIALRDSAGRMKASAPSASTDVARKAEVDAHTARTDNPHSVTKAQVGLGSVSNDQQLMKASNFADVPDKPTARSNLGLKSAATTEASAYATAAQGETADSALQPTDTIDADRLGGYNVTEIRPVIKKSGLYQFSGGAVPTYYHNQGSTPDHVWATLVCWTADSGYAYGDEIEHFRIWDRRNDTEKGPLPIVKNSSTIRCYLGDHDLGVINPVAANNADFVHVNKASWRLRLSGVWYA